jgi:hypothetical protein
LTILSVDSVCKIRAEFPLPRNEESFGRQGLYVVCFINLTGFLDFFDFLEARSASRLRFLEGALGRDFWSEVQFCEGRKVDFLVDGVFDDGTVRDTSSVTFEFIILRVILMVLET